MRNNIFFRFVTFYSIISIFLQSLLPFFSAVPRKVLAQDTTPTITEAPVVTPEEIINPTMEPVVTIEPTVTVEPTESVTPTLEPTGEPTILPTGEITPTTIPTETPNKNKNTEVAGPTATPEVTTQVTPSPTQTPVLDEVIHLEVVKLDGSYADPSLVPATWTDKLDYAPTEKVIVSGKHFIAEQTYSIKISSTDEPAVTHEGGFVADTDGTFTYEYQLDGNYRPNYAVEIKDTTGAVVATTTFLDHFNYVIRVNNNAATTTIRSVTLNMSWQELLFDPTEARFAQVGGSASCPSDSSSNWGSWQSLAQNNNSATASWTISGGAGNKKICSQTRHWLLFGWSVESSFDTILYTPDETAPVITLIGANPQIIEAGTSYSELGATVTDNIDTGLIAQINTSLVNTSLVGEYSVTYNATDSAVNAAIQVVRTVRVIDTAAPAIPTLVSPANGASVTNSMALLDWTDVTDLSGPVVYYYQSAWNGGSYGPALIGTPSQVDASGSVEQTYTWQVKACDTQANCSNWSGPWTVTIDSTAPAKPTLISPLNNTYHASSTLTNSWQTVAGTDTYIYESYNDAGATNLRWHQEVTAPTTSKTATGLTDTIFWWRVRAVDAAGNVGVWSDLWKVTVDTTKPATPTISSPTTEQYFRTTPILNQWSAISDFSGIKQYIVKYQYDDNHAFPDMPYRYTTTNSRNHSPGITEQGGVTIWVQAEDNAGNLSNWSSSVHYIYDATAPTITIANPNVLPEHNKTISAITTEGILTMAETRGNICNGTLTFVTYAEKTYSTEGDNGIKICYKAQDLAGNIAFSLSNTIEGIDYTNPSVLDIEFPTPGPTATSFKVVFSEDVNATDAVNPALYFLNNWPGAGGSGDLTGDATIVYDQVTKTATVTFIHAGWYVSPEQEWGVQDITDLAGNPLAPSPYTKHSTPLVAPVTTTSGIDALWHSSATITFTCTDPSGSGCKATYYTTDGSTPTTTSATGNSVTLDTNGTYSISYFSVDNAGNSETVKQEPQVVQIETNNPASTITLPANAGSGATEYLNDWTGRIEGTATDDISGVASVELSIKNSEGKYWNGVDWSSDSEVFVVATGTNSWSYQLPTPIEGIYTIHSHAIDAATNRESTYTLIVVLDKTIPEVAISLNPTVGDAANGWYKTQPEVTLTATDTNIDTIEYQWNGTSGIWTTYTGPFKPLNEGANVLYYRAIDLADNYSETGIKNIKWNKTDLKNGPLNVNVSPNPTSESTSKVTWDAALSDTIGIDKYEVQWKLKNGDKTYTVTVGSDVREYTVDKLTEGVWEVKVTAFDASGNNKSASADLTVDRTGPATPTLSIFGTAAGSVSLSWNKIDGANNYILWYGTTSGNYQYGAKVGDTQNYTVQGLGAGSYYFIVKAVDSSGNQSSNSNEVSTGQITGAIGVTPGTPATGFAEEVLGANTLSPTPEVSPTGSVLGEGTENGKKAPWWWPWILLLLLPPSWFGYKKWKALKDTEPVV